MNINNRFKMLRSALHLSQEEIGKAIGLSKSGISNIESGSRSVTDKHVKLLFSAFNVNEIWLRQGTGNMFLENDNTLLTKLITEYHMSPAQQRIMETFLHMDDQKREAVSQALFMFIDTLQQTNPITVSNPAESEADDDYELKQRQEIIAAEFDAEKKGKMSLASTGINGHIKRA